MVHAEFKQDKYVKQPYWRPSWCFY